MPYTLVPPRPGKTPYWSVRGTHCGVYIDKSTGFTEKAKAAAQLRLWRDDAERGRLSRLGEPIFLDAICDYIDAGGEARFLGTYDDETGTWSGIAGKIGGLPLSAIDQAQIDRLALDLYPRGTAQTRNRNLYTPISAVLKHAGVKIEIERPKGWAGKKKTAWLWPERAFAIFAAADHVDAEFGIFLRTLCYTGVRLTEACSLKIDDVNLSEAFAYLPDSKNEEPRAIFLPPALVSALGNHPRGLDRHGQTVFRFRKNGRIYLLLARVLARAGVELPPRTAFHVFCHTYATWLRRYAGLDTDGLVETGRWKDRKSAARYTHVEVSEASRKATLLPVENPGTRPRNRRKPA